MTIRNRVAIFLMSAIVATTLLFGLTACTGTPIPTAYTVAFDANEGENPPAPYTDVQLASKISAPNAETMVRDGYTFTGRWFKEATCTHEWIFDTDFVTGNITLYASWSDNSNPTVTYYSVTFNANGGTGAPSALTNVESGSKISQPDVTGMANSDMIFSGWYKESACTNPWNFSSDTVTSNTILYAGWTPAAAEFSVDFDANGGSSAPTGYTGVTAGSVISSPDEGSMEKTGYEFDGNWYKEPEMENAWNFETDTVTSDITLYAGWTIIKYRVTFVENSGGDAVANMPEGAVENEGYFLFDYNTSIGNVNEPTRSGYRFDGWINADTLEAWDLAEDRVLEDIELLATWVQTVTVTFNTQGGSAVSQAVIDKGSKVQQPANPTATNPETHEFYGWFTSGAFTSEFDFDAEINENVTVYAMFDAKRFDVVFNANFGVNEDGNSLFVERIKLDQAIADNLPTVTRSGYSLVGWFADRGLTTALSNQTPSASEVVMVHAKWELSTVINTFANELADRNVNYAPVTSGEDEYTPTYNPAITTYQELNEAVRYTRQKVFVLDENGDPTEETENEAPRYYYLANDIFIPSNYNWVAPTTEFEGHFDGNNFAIAGLKVTSSKQAGLFCGLKTSTVRNIVFIDPVITSSGDRAAVVSGTVNSKNTVLIENIAIYNATVSAAATNGAAGVVASIGGSTLTIRNIYIKGGLFNNSSNAIGGIVAVCGSSNDPVLTISDVQIDGTTLGASGSLKQKVGGIVGESKGSAVLSITRVVVNNITIYASKNSGGIVGCNTSSSSINISNVYYNGSLTLNSDASNGYIVGYSFSNVTTSNIIIITASADDDWMKNQFSDTNNVNLVKSSDTPPIDLAWFDKTFKANNYPAFLSWTFDGGLMNLDVIPVNVFTVTVDLNDDSLTNYSIYVRSGELTLDTPAILDGSKKFVGWTIANADWANGSTVAEKCTIKANWEQRYKVSFDVGGGTVTAGELPEAGYADKDSFVANPNVTVTKEHKIFKGWFVEDVEWVFDGEANPSAVDKDIVIVAKWEDMPLVSFNLNGGTVGGENAIDSVYKYPNDKLEDIGDAEQEGFYFLGWFTADEFDKPDGTAWNFGIDTVGSSSFELKAKWETMYLVSFNLSALDATIDDLPTPKYYRAGSQLNNPGTPLLAGHIFEGWYTDATEGDKWVFIDEEGTVSEVGDTLTLYARWAVDQANSDNRDVLFIYNYTDAEEGISADDVYSQIIVNWHSGIVTPPADPVREGYFFMGWYKDAECTVAWKFEGDEIDKVLESDEEVKLYARWALKLTIIYDTDGGSSNTTLYHADGEPLEKINSVPEKSGFRFSHWSTEKGGNEYTGFDVILSNDDLTDGTLTLYAVWVQQVTVEFYDIDGTLIEAFTIEEDVDTVVGAEDVPALPTEDNLDGTEWNTSADGTGTAWAGGKLEENLKLYAIYTATIRFYNADSVELENERLEVYYNGTVTLPTAPTVEGKNFVAWNTQANGSGTGYTASFTATQHLDLYAVYEEPFPESEGWIAISTAQELNEAVKGKDINGTTKTKFYLTKDIDIADAIANEEGFDGWTQATTTFEGIFDGNNKRISNLNIAKTSGVQGIFFDVKKTAEIRNLSLYNCSVEGSDSNGTGLLVGRTNDDSAELTLKNISIVNSSSTSSTGATSLLLGRTSKGKTIIIENIYIKNSTISTTGENSAPLVGQLSAGSLTVTNAVIDGVTFDKSAKRQGFVYSLKGGTATLKNILVINCSASSSSNNSGYISADTVTPADNMENIFVNNCVLSTVLSAQSGYTMLEVAPSDTWWTANLPSIAGSDLWVLVGNMYVLSNSVTAS